MRGEWFVGRGLLLCLDSGRVGVSGELELGVNGRKGELG